MKKTLEIFKYLIILTVVIGTIFFLNSIVEQFLIIQIISYILFLVYSVSIIMLINFVFKLDKTKNNLEGEKTKYYVSGEKFSEGTYKDGKLIFIKRWNEDGSVKE